MVGLESGWVWVVSRRCKEGGDGGRGGCSGHGRGVVVPDRPALRGRWK